MLETVAFRILGWGKWAKHQNIWPIHESHILVYDDAWYYDTALLLYGYTVYCSTVSLVCSVIPFYYFIVSFSVTGYTVIV